VFFDLDRQPFHIIRGVEDRRYVELDQISRSLQLSVVAIEDGRFFRHLGFDPIRITAVVLRLFRKDASLQGASTITQQLIKLTLLSPEIRLRRKVMEILMAIAIERSYTKAEILEFYLNKVYLGQGSYGVENAARHFFQKTAAELTLAESALLAGLIKKPEGYSPFVDLEMARRRQVLVLNRLLDLGWISDLQYRTAFAEQLIIRERPSGENQLAPHFTAHVLQLLKHQFGDRMIYGGGLRIYTTLDRQLQQQMTAAIEEQFIESSAFSEVAGLSLDPATGFVKAMVGGIDFTKSKFNRATQARRQPGSSFKPILYATALTAGIKPNDVFWDEPTQYTRRMGDDLEIYEPGNHSGNHLGPMTAAYALKTSNNVVSVQILNQIGIPALMQKAAEFDLALPNRQGLCLALGCGETTLERLVSAYGVFANQGLRNPPVYILKITDAAGKTLFSYRPGPEIRVLSRDQTFQMNHMLQETVNHGTGRNARIDRPAGGKTGTSDWNRDAWFVGYTPELVTGFWVGNDDNSPTIGETGSRTPAILWRTYMQSIPTAETPRRFAINENFEEYLLCNQSGRQASAHCPNTSWYALRPEEAPLDHCPLHRLSALEIKICRVSGQLATEYCPPKEVASEFFIPGTEPTEFCDTHSPLADPTRQWETDRGLDFDIQVQPLR
jgi:penicillin-binding protein 1A